MEGGKLSENYESCFFSHKYVRIESSTVWISYNNKLQLYNKRQNAAGGAVDDDGDWGNKYVVSEKIV